MVIRPLVFEEGNAKVSVVQLKPISFITEKNEYSLRVQARTSDKGNKEHIANNSKS